MKTDKLKLFVLALIAFFIVAVLFTGCASIDPATRYAKEHSALNYHEVMKDSESFTIGSLKEDRRELKKQIRNGNKKNGHESKKDRLKKELEEFRAKAEENK